MGLICRNGIYYIKVERDGRRIVRTTGTRDKTQAQELHDRFVADLWRETRLGDKPKYTWGEAVSRWLSEKRDKSSLDTDKSRLLWLSSEIGAKRPLVSLTNEFVERLIESRQKCKRHGRPLTAATVNRTLAALSGVLNCARQWGWIDATPYIRHLPEPKKRVNFLSREELHCLIVELPQNLAEITAFAVLTGLRENNILGLQWKDVDLERGVCWVHHDEAKGKKAIGVPLSHDAVSVLQMRIGHSQPFGPMTRVSNHPWYKARKRAGMPTLRFHDLRHTWASWHTMNGTPRAVLQELGAWSDGRMVERYSHLAPGYLAQFAGNAAPRSGTKSDTARKARGG
jgi:integrase